MKKRISRLLVGALFLSLLVPSFAHAEAKDTVTYNDINRMLTESALEHNIPPEIAKAVAFQENGWKQWSDDAQTEPIINITDGGIGLMQVTSNVCEEGNTKNCYDPDRLGDDIQYNIDAGLEILNEKWSYGDQGIIPTINTNDRDILEHWYFAVMAYNGTVPVNSPYFRDAKDGTRNLDTYQDEVFNKVEQRNYFSVNLDAIEFQRSDFTYDKKKDEPITFNKMHYTVNSELTRSRTLLEEGDKVATVAGKLLKKEPSSENGVNVKQSQVATVLSSEFHIDETKNQGKIPYDHWVRYHVELEDGTRGYMASSSLIPITQRLSGDNRYKTAIEISKDGWQDGADTVVLSRGYEFPDALAGAPLAYQLDAPILLTDDKILTKETADEIKRLGAKKVIILGSDNAVRPAVEKELINKGLKTERIGGEDRFETAQLIAKKLDSSSDKAVVAYGYNFPDALAVAPYAAKEGMPILLTRDNKLPDYTKEALADTKETIVVGGDDVVQKNVYDQLPGHKRLAGDDRYETAAEIIGYFDDKAQTGYVATGVNFADALTGAVLAAKNDSPLLLAKKDQLSPFMEATITDLQTEQFVLLGGPDVVSVEDRLAKLTIK
ncbi:cell wall-binding repeat-containing protein [Guptibacillus hwajinpoensis]|uniref:cell wall-binding repeat-containing protein n=1 Tax=Guptibacillus hwajinpoensis TaxID=208199 RepID=UPI003735B2B3